jgi:hypothetical protein
MGGFKPSRADIAGSTIVGSDKDLDTHAFTGSVDITGSLTLNGSAVTGGGGGGTPGGATTQIQYNDAGAFAGSANLTFDGSNLKTTGSLYLSSSVAGSGVPLLRLDHAGTSGDNPILFVTGSGFVGIGVLEPTYHLQVAASFPGGANPTNRAFKVQGDDGSEWFTINGGIISFNTAGGSTKAGGIDLGQRFNIAPINASLGALGIGKYPGSTANIVQVNSANTNLSGNFFVIDPDGKVGIGIPTNPVPASWEGPTELLDVRGNAAISGAFGSTSIETLTANGTISAGTGLTLVDASSSLAVNNTLVFSIADGTFAGQEKKIRGLIISGSNGANSTGVYIFGSNIDSPPSLGGNGQIVLSSSNPAAGPNFQRAGCSLVWGGTKWLPVGNYNFDINSTGF